MIDYPAALAVMMVVQTGSFEKAARILNVTPSAISQRVKAIEEKLGVSLIERGNPCVATERGEWLCRHMEHVGMLERELEQHLPGLVGDADPVQRVTLNLAVNADSLGTWFLEAAAAFTRRSDYLLSITIEDEGHTVDWLQRGRVLAAVTSIAKPVHGCRVIRLGAQRYRATASPDFMDRHFPNGVTVASAGLAPALTFNLKDRLQQEWLRTVLGETVIGPTHLLPSTEGFVHASLSGMGWGMNPDPMVAEHLASGRLVELVPGRTLEVPLFWQVNRLAADRLQGLTREVTRIARQALVQA